MSRPRRRHRLVVAGVVALLLSTGCNQPRQPAAPDPPPDVAQPGERPSRAPSQTRRERKPRPPQPQRLTVRITRIRDEPQANSGLHGTKPRPGPRIKRAVRQAARREVGRLQRYLNATFVEPRTRGARAPLRALLSRRARRLLGPRDLRALTLRGGPPIQGGGRTRATARVVVLHAGPRMTAVTVTYSARLRLRRAGTLQHLRQEGSMVFVPRGGRWRADHVAVRLFRQRQPDRGQPDKAQPDKARRDKARRDKGRRDKGST